MPKKSKIAFGKHAKTVTEGDSTKTTTKLYRDGVVHKETNYYEERIRVANEAEELQETIRHMKNTKGKNRATRVEYVKDTNHYYYLVKCWEE